MRLVAGLAIWLLGGLISMDAIQSQELMDMHLWARTLEAEGDPVLIRLNGQSRLFSGELRLLAQRLRWAPDADLLSADGQVELAAPAWELRAESLEFRPALAYLTARQLHLNYRDLQLQAARAEMSAEVWQLHEVEVRLRDSPLVLQAHEVRILPGRLQENLLLEGITLPGLPWRWPALTLSLPELAPEQAEIRAPASVFQPELGLAAGGLRAGFSSELWRDQQQRFYGRFSFEPQLGPLAELAHEWRPDNDWLLHSQLGLGNNGLQARAEALWQTPLGLWLRGRGRWQQPDSFLAEFWLPPLAITPVPASDLEFWLASEWLSWPQWPALRTRVLAGARWPQQQAGLTWLAQLPLWQTESQLLEASSLINGFYLADSSGFVGTAGTRLLFQQTLLDNLTLGGSLEQYMSSLTASGFTQPERLSPWLSVFALWQPWPDLGLGCETAISLTSGRLVLADALVSWRLRPFYVHLLMQGIPPGLQLQTRFEL